MAMMTTGLQVATTQDLNQALGTIDNKFDEHKRWTENHITECIMKIRLSTERVDAVERDYQASVETISSDLKSLRAGSVTNMAFRQHANDMEKRFQQQKDETDSKVEQCKLGMEKEIASSVGNLRLKAETLNANCIALTEKCKVLEETLIPAIKADMEEQKAKRLAETQRLESEIEKMKELCEQKISHTAAALRFYVTATATKLREELAPMTMAKEMEEDIKQKELDLMKKIKMNEEALTTQRETVHKFMADLDVVHEKHTADISQHTKALKVQEITITNLQNGIASDLNDMREQMRTDRVNIQTEVTDARAAAARGAASNENAIAAVSNEINPLRQFRELILERLHIEKFVEQVRSWQTGHVPQITSTVKDLEERVKKVQNVSGKDHDLLMELKTGVVAIRGHFKMFHQIAAGLDDKPIPGEMHSLETAPSEDTRLPPINSARGPRSPPLMSTTA